MDIYKSGQGRYTRIITFVAGSLVGLLLAQYVWKEMQATMLPRFVIYIVPMVMVVGAAALMYLLVNRPKTADFMIATEGEMKKVSW
ncbi:hypothetical protein LCGC14_2419060, partial [marine sediment metagenome]